jgi:mRNA interferase MazF
VNVPTQGEVWWAEAPDLGRRPVLVVTRNAALPVLNRILIAPVTRTVRDIPTEVALGAQEGLSQDCAASFDNLQPIPRLALIERAGGLGPSRNGEICRALGALADCW